MSLNLRTIINIASAILSQNAINDKKIQCISTGCYQKVYYQRVSHPKRTKEPGIEYSNDVSTMQNNELYKLLLARNAYLMEKIKVESSWENTVNAKEIPQEILTTKHIVYIVKDLDDKEEERA